MVLIPLTLIDAQKLRALLTQTASPDSFQAHLIERIDAQIEEHLRPRRGQLRASRHAA